MTAATLSSVHILIDNADTECLMFVEQVRVPALVNNPESDGVYLEMCAGIIDKDYSVKQITKEEILEEMGYDILLEQIRPVRNYLSSVGTQATNVHCFSAIVLENQKVSEGGGLESEDIKVTSIPYHEIIDLINGFGEYKKIFTDSTTLYLVTMWLLDNTQG